MISFKQFLNEDSPIIKHDSSISGADFEVIVATAKSMVRGGYAKNYLKMVEAGEFFIRGSEYLADKMSSKVKTSGKGVLGIIEPARTKDRVSTFNKNQFTFNAWHLFDMPSRKRCTMATLDVEMAGNFSDNLFILIPKDGTTVYYIESDWNLGFKKSVKQVFNRSLYLGNLSYVFRGFTQLPGSNVYTDLFNKLNGSSEQLNLETLRDMCEELDLLLFNTDYDDLGKIREMPLVSEVIEQIKMKVTNGVESFDLLQKFFKTAKDEVSETNDISSILSSNNKQIEIWWEGNSYALWLKSSAELKELELILRDLVK